MPVESNFTTFTAYSEDIAKKALTALLDETVPSDYEPELTQEERYAQYVIDNHKTLYTKLQSEIKSFEGSIDTKEIEVHAKRANNDYVPLTDDEVNNRKKIHNEVANATIDYAIRSALAEQSVFYGEKLSRVQRSLLDISGTDESFTRNQQLKEMFQGPLLERQQAYCERLAEIGQTDLSSVDLSNDALLAENLKTMSSLIKVGPDLINAMDDLTQMGFPFGSQEDYDKLAQNMNFLGSYAYLAREKADIISSSAYYQCRMEDVKLNALGSFDFDDEMISIGQYCSTNNAAAAFSQSVFLNEMRKVDPYYDIFLNEGKTYNEREAEYSQKFSIKDTEYIKFRPDEPKSERKKEKPVEQNNASDNELSNLSEDGSIDAYKDAISKNQYETKITQNIARLKRIDIDVDISDEEIQEMISPDRLKLHEKAKAFLAEQAKIHDSISYGHHKFPGQTIRIASYLMDTSDTPGAKLYNEKLMRAFDPSTEFVEDKLEILTDVFNRVTKLDFQKLTSPTSVEERLDYAIEHYQDLRIAFGIQSALKSKSEIGAMGLSYRDDKVELMSQIRTFAENIGSTGCGFLDLVASEEFLTVPFDKIDTQKLKEANNIQFTGEDPEKEQELAFYTSQVFNNTERYLFGFNDCDLTSPNVTFSSDAKDSPFIPVEHSYGSVKFSSLSDVADKLRSLSGDLDNAAKQSKEKSSHFSTLQTQLSDLNRVLNDIKDLKIIDSDSEKRLSDAITPISKTVYLFKKELGKDAKKQDLLKATTCVGDLIKDFAGQPDLVKSRVEAINTFKESNFAKQELFEQIDKIAITKANFDTGNTESLNNMVDELFAWNMSALDLNGNNYERMHNFIEAYVNWSVNNTLELGKEVQKVQEETELLDFQAASIAGQYSIPARKQFGIERSQAYAAQLLNDCDDYEIMAAQYGEPTNVLNINRYVTDQVALALQQKRENADEKTKHLLDLGILAQNAPARENARRQYDKDLLAKAQLAADVAQNVAEDMVKKGGKAPEKPITIPKKLPQTPMIPHTLLGSNGYVDNYSSAQQRELTNTIPESIRLSSFNDFRSHLESIATVANELTGINRFGHINSSDFSNLKKAINDLNQVGTSISQLSSIDDLTPDQMTRAGNALKAVTDCTAKYLANKWNDRKTELGQRRFDKAVELLQKLDPERANTIEKTINNSRTLSGKAHKYFPQVNKVSDVQPVAKSNSYVEWFTSAPIGVTHYREKLENMRADPKTFNAETAKECVAGIMLGAAMNDKFVESYPTEASFIKATKRVVGSPEFNQIVSKMDVSDIGKVLEKGSDQELLIKYDTLRKKDEPKSEKSRARANAVHTPTTPKKGGLHT